MLASEPFISFANGDLISYQLIPVPAGDDRPYLVFLHEGLGCQALWKGFPELLCQATACPGLVYDRLGYGQSSPLRHTRTLDYMHDYARQELPQVLKAVIPGKTFILIGHSDGGSISLIYGADHKDRQRSLLKGIITEAAHVFVEPETIVGIEAAALAWQAGKLKGLAKYHGDKTENIFKAWADTWLTDWFRLWNIEALLPEITAPLLVLQGQEDQYGSSAQVDAIVQQSSGPAEARMLEDCRHTPHLEAQELVLHQMADFIKRLT
ncbi:alpha/beta hydrolase [Thalassomonas haliotis]|uniref:Alpha/beta hydrolase n=1 Tax=Thalassomonas haliotis TaxID=485448 RepID=A0ABY7VLX2_9GAMM|nr:alpha/beta hydrolase [Thalassomonas haliotis]